MERYMFRNSRAKNAMLALGALVFLAFTGGVTYLVYQQYFLDGGESTESRSRASSATGTVQLTLESDATDRYVKDTFPVRVYLDTAGKSVTGVAFGLSYDSGTGTTPDLEIVDSDTGKTGIQIESLAKDLNPCFGTEPQVNLVSRATGTGNKKIFIEYSALCPAGYTSPATGKVHLATIWLRANAVGTGTFLLESDPSKAIATDKTSGADILQTITPKEFRILADTQKPVADIVSGPAEDSSTASGRIVFTLGGRDLPPRVADTLQPEGTLQYSYYFGNTHTAPLPANATANFGALNAAGTAITAGQWTNNPTINMVLGNGPKTLYVRVRDLNGNISSILERQFTLNLTPFIETATPASGPENTVVTLTGYNFGTTKGTVRMGTVTVPAANVTTWTNEQIVFKVPITANGDISVKSAAAPDFSAAKPFKLETKIVLDFVFQGISGTNPPTDIPLTLAVTKAGTVVANITNARAKWVPATSNYQVEVVLPDNFGQTAGFAATGHLISIKDDAHLRRRFDNITLTRGKVNSFVKKHPGDFVLAGDFNGDNKLNIQDFGLMMTHIKSLQNAVTDQNKKFDINGDGNINFADVALLLTNYTSLELPGNQQ